MLTYSNFLLFSGIYQFQLPVVLLSAQSGYTRVKLNPHPTHLSTLLMFTQSVLTNTHHFSDYKHIQKD